MEDQQTNNYLCINEIKLEQESQPFWAANSLTHQVASCKWTKYVVGEQKRNKGWQLVMQLGDTHQWMLLKSRMVSIPIFAAMAHPFMQHMKHSYPAEVTKVSHPFHLIHIN